MFVNIGDGNEVKEGDFRVRLIHQVVVVRGYGWVAWTGLGMLQKGSGAVAVILIVLIKEMLDFHIPADFHIRSCRQSILFCFVVVLRSAIRVSTQTLGQGAIVVGIATWLLGNHEIELSNCVG